jgi:glycerol kinase
MELDTAIEIKQLMVDGGITSNQFVLQFLSDLLDIPIVNIGQSDVSALGSAYMAGLKIGIYKNVDHLAQLNADKKILYPSFNDKVKSAYDGWKRSVLNNS